MQSSPAVTCLICEQTCRVRRASCSPGGCSLCVTQRAGLWEPWQDFFIFFRNPGACHIPGKASAIELYPQLFCFVLFSLSFFLSLFWFDFLFFKDRLSRSPGWLYISNAARNNLELLTFPRPTRAQIIGHLFLCGCLEPGNHALLLAWKDFTAAAISPALFLSLRPHYLFIF